MRPVGVIAALPAEGRCLAGFRLSPGATVTLPDSVLLQLSGVGELRAYQAAKALLHRGASALVSWGTAGALEPSFAAGTLLLPDRVIDARQESYSPDEVWRERLGMCLGGGIEGPVAAGVLIHSQGMQVTPEAKSALFQDSGAVAVDMESAAVAALARQARIPFLSVRAIVDPPLETLPQAVIGALDPEGRQRSLRFLGALLKRPTELPAATRMIGYWCAAQRTLRWVAQRAGPRLQAP